LPPSSFWGYGDYAHLSWETAGAAFLTARFVGVAAGGRTRGQCTFHRQGTRSMAERRDDPLAATAVPFDKASWRPAFSSASEEGDLSYYTYAAIALFVGLLVVYWVWFQRLWRAAFVLPS
jgi:hypothetical protein